VAVVCRPALSSSRNSLTTNLTSTDTTERNPSMLPGAHTVASLVEPAHGSDHRFVPDCRWLVLLGLLGSAGPGRDDAGCPTLRPAGFQQPYGMGDAL
jgi:hypothetical protein